MPVARKISIREYAKEIGVNEKAIRKAIKDGKIKTGYDSINKKIIPNKANKEYGNIHLIKKVGPGISKQTLIKNQICEIPSEPANLYDDKNVDQLLSEIKLSVNLSYAEAARRREIIGAALDLKKLQEQERILVRRTEVEKVLFVLGDNLKKAILNVPVRIADRLLTCKNRFEMIAIMEDELKNILSKFSDMKSLPIDDN